MQLLKSIDWASAVATATPKLSLLVPGEDGPMNQ